MKRLLVVATAFATMALSCGAQGAEQPYDITYCLKPAGGGDVLLLTSQGRAVSSYRVQGKSWTNDSAKKALDGFSLDCVGVQHSADPTKVDTTGYCTWTSPDLGDYFIGRFSKASADAKGNWEVLAGTGRFAQITTPQSQFASQQPASLARAEESNRAWSWCYTATGMINMQ